MVRWSDLHFHYCSVLDGVSPITTSGITPRMDAGSGSSTCKHICPLVSHSGSITKYSSWLIRGDGGTVVIGLPEGVGLNCLTGMTVLKVRPIFMPLDSRARIVTRGIILRFPCIVGSPASRYMVWS